MYIRKSYAMTEATACVHIADIARACEECAKIVRGQTQYIAKILR